MRRLDRDFRSHGLKCAGWLFLPEGVTKPPVVIMAHGIAAERTFRLPAFAEKFTARGLACFVFDYRNFGDSEGEPRQLVSPDRHLRDWRAAIACVRRFKDINPERIALWGSSFSGGHVLAIASETPGLSAVVAQVPFVDGAALARLAPRSFQIEATLKGLRDLGRAMTFRPPYCVPVVAEPGEFALMNTPESKPGYLALVPPGSKWKNEVPARIFLEMPRYRPALHADKITCPVLLVIAEKDSLIPAGDVEKAAARIPKARIVKFPVNHFAVYVGEPFEQVSEIEGKFLQEQFA
ncbi:MAG: alpha/beta fold hydrolase [bacterium]|nr:alpha/beta fold hydrolase [bacterium]